MIPRWKNNRQLRGRANCYSIARDKIVPLEYEQLSLIIIYRILLIVLVTTHLVSNFFFYNKSKYLLSICYNDKYILLIIFIKYAA